MPTPLELDLARIRQFCDAKLPTHLRDEARVEVDVSGTSVTVLDCRAPWQPGTTDWSRVPVAQLRYDRGSQVWTLYWADRNGCWRRHEEVEPGGVVDLLAELDADPSGIFWG